MNVVVCSSGLVPQLMYEGILWNNVLYSLIWVVLQNFLSQYYTYKLWYIKTEWMAELNTGRLNTVKTFGRLCMALGYARSWTVHFYSLRKHCRLTCFYHFHVIIVWYLRHLPHFNSVVRNLCSKCIPQHLLELILLSLALYIYKFFYCPALQIILHVQDFY